MFLIKNRYYNDYGLDYVFDRLADEFNKRGIMLNELTAPVFGYGNDAAYFISEVLPSCENAVIFWDKDIRLARALEGRGVRLLPNCAGALEACDDKELTYSKLAGLSIPLIKTISAPLVFDVNLPLDKAFLGYVERELGYPIVIKDNVGSQGKQVYLAKDRKELEALNQKLVHKPHIYQEFKGEFGSDIRVYILGGKAVASVKRSNTTNFKSNIAMGGNMERYELTDNLKSLAETIAKALKLEYGSVDFLISDTPLFVEANSNAYFKGIESLGVPMAQMLADYMIGEIALLSKGTIK